MKIFTSGVFSGECFKITNIIFIDMELFKMSISHFNFVQEVLHCTIVIRLIAVNSFLLYYLCMVGSVEFLKFIVFSLIFLCIYLLKNFKEL